jgi:hypothetical protein
VRTRPASEANASQALTATGLDHHAPAIEVEL